MMNEVKHSDTFQERDIDQKKWSDKLFKTKKRWWQQKKNDLQSIELKMCVISATM